MVDRVCIGSCIGPADAAVVRAMLAGHGIASVVTGEQHANVFGVGGGLISLELWVAAGDAEPAMQLMRELRGGGGGVTADDADDAAGVDDADDADDSDDRALLPVEARIDRRKRTGVVLVLGLCVTFGTAHMYTRAWMRGISLAALELVAFFQLGHSATRGAALLAAAVATDVIGAIVRVRADTAPSRLPAATLRR